MKSNGRGWYWDPYKMDLHILIKNHLGHGVHTLVRYTIEPSMADIKSHVKALSSGVDPHIPDGQPLTIDEWKAGGFHHNHYHQVFPYTITK